MGDPLFITQEKKKFRPLPEPIKLQDLLNSARSRTEKKLNKIKQTKGTNTDTR